MNIQIQPLDPTTLKSAITLRDSVFPGLNKTEYATLAASLSKNNSEVYKQLGIVTLNYWMAVDNNQVILGLVGLYTESDDEANQIWLGWYCVEPSARGRGIGEFLLHYAIDIAKQRGYKELKLYTTMADEYSVARRLYERIGFRDTTRTKNSKTRYYTVAIGA